MMQNSRNTYSHSTKYICNQGITLHPATVYLEEIVFIQLQGNDILVNCKGNQFIQRTYIYSQKV